MGEMCFILLRNVQLLFLINLNMNRKFTVKYTVFRILNLVLVSTKTSIRKNIYQYITPIIHKNKGDRYECKKNNLERYSFYINIIR